MLGAAADRVALSVVRLRRLCGVQFILGFEGRRPALA
jgi:hypothetical protein